MKIATYNQMFGLNGSSFMRNILAHWDLHWKGNLEKIVENSDMSKTIETVKKSNADIIGICEVIGAAQEAKLRKSLSDLGYTSFLSDKGRITKKNKDANLRVLLASKEGFELEAVSGSSEFKFPLNGGELVHGYIPNYDLDIIHTHLIVPRGRKRKKVHKKLIHILLDAVQKKRKGKNLIIMGDFNIRYKTLIRKYPYFANFFNLTQSLNTWSVNALTRNLIGFDFDHILGKGFTLYDHGIIYGQSDHALIWTEAEIEKK